MRLNRTGAPRMPGWIATRRVLMVAIVALGVTACSGAARSVVPSATPSLTPITAPPATPPSEPNATPDEPAPSLGEPPRATLAVEGGDPVAGALGSFTWADGGSDSPWLAGAPIAVGSGETLAVHLPDGVPVADWSVKRIPAGTAEGVGTMAIAGGRTTPIAFPAPGPGRWSTQLVITFGDGLGSATYYWAVTAR